MKGGDTREKAAVESYGEDCTQARHAEALEGNAVRVLINGETGLLPNFSIHVSLEVKKWRD
jgi:hypothetical protein